MPPMNQLTVLQRRVLDVFRQRASAGAPPPTYRELCKEFGWRSTGTARDHLKALVRKGALDAAEGRARGAHLHTGPTEGTVPLPLVGGVVAGLPGVSDKLVEAHIPVPAFLVPSGDGFLLPVTGDSMEGAGDSERFGAYCRERGYKKSTLVARLIREHLDSEGFVGRGERKAGPVKSCDADREDRVAAKGAEPSLRVSRKALKHG